MSWQARAAVWLLRATLKRKLENARTVEDMRRLLTGVVPRTPSGVRIRQDRIGTVPGEWVETPGGGPQLVYLHGGGYIACSPATHRGVTAALAQRGFRIFAPAYRLAPEHPFPAALHDALEVWRGLENAGFLAGDSAGGGLALSVMAALRDEGHRLPKAAALFSPWTDLAATGASLTENDGSCALFRGRLIGAAGRHYLGRTDARNPQVSPLYADLRGLPPLLIHASRDETLRDDSTRLAERARRAGVLVDLRLWQGVPHTWQLAPAIFPEARESLDQAAEFLHKADG